MGNALKDISILIVTWNGDELLADCLSSLRETCGDAPEIVVVDNAAGDSTRKIVADYPNARYVASALNTGFAGGNNLGLPYCTRSRILLLNNDTVVHTRETFERLSSFLDEHPLAGVVQGKLILARQEGLLDECGSKMSAIGELADSHFREPAATVVPTHQVFHAKGACMMFRREVLEALGGVLFHGHFRSYGEDVDFCHRAWLAGYEVWYVDTPPVSHLCGATSSKLPKVETEAAIIANRVFSYLVNFGWYGKLRVLIPLIAVYLFRFTGTSLLGNFRNAKIYIEAMKSVWRRRGEISAARKIVKSFRRLGDREFLRKVR